MMRKFKLKGLKLTSPRKEQNDNTPHSPVSIDSQDDSYCTPDDPKSGDGPNTPKRRSLFKTLRRKLNPSNRKSDSGRRTQTWHVEAGASSGGSFSGSATLPNPKQTASWRAAPRRLHKPLRPAVSEEGLADDRSPEFLRRSRMSHGERPSEHSSSSYHKHDIFVKHEQCSSKSEDESEKEESQHDEDGKVLLPMDTEYGHASAPSSNEQSTTLPTSSSNDSDIVQSSLGAEGPKDVQSPTHTCSSSQPDGNEQSDISVVQTQTPVQSQGLTYEHLLSTKPWSLTDELFRLPKYGWYWGPITRVEAEEKLANQPDGAFLVRDSSDERYLLSLSFRSYGRTLHTRIEHCNGVFSFYAQPECEGYKSVVSLIHHSMTDSQSGVFCYSRARTPGAPSFPVRLTKPVSRFTHVRSLQYLCRFVIRQNTRYDHLQKLPLPTSIKGWLEENQY